MTVIVWIIVCIFLLFLIVKKEYQIIYYRYEDGRFIVCDEDQATHKFYEGKHELTKLGIKGALDKFAKEVEMLDNKGGNNG